LLERRHLEMLGHALVSVPPGFALGLGLQCHSESGWEMAGVWGPGVAGLWGAMDAEDTADIVDEAQTGARSVARQQEVLRKAHFAPRKKGRLDCYI
jgi:hypothetical protein